MEGLSDSTLAQSASGLSIVTFFNLYAEYIMRNAGIEEVIFGITVKLFGAIVTSDMFMIYIMMVEAG